MSALDHVENARAAYAAREMPLPAWVADLAAECARSNQASVARAMDYSPATISQVLNAKYRGDLTRIKEVFEGVFRNALVDCPALGSIPLHECHGWRSKSRTFVSVNALRVRMYRACTHCPRNMKEVSE